jgi:hypothetical protein
MAGGLDSGFVANPPHPLIHSVFSHLLAKGVRVQPPNSSKTNRRSSTYLIRNNFFNNPLSDSLNRLVFIFP